MIVFVVFGKMCLASEAGKMDTVISPPEDSSSTAFLQQTADLAEIKEEKANTDYSPPSPHTSALLPPPPSITSTSTDAIPPQLSSQNACVKKKSKKKDVAKSIDNSELPCLTKKKCDEAESQVDSVFSTIEAVAKGAWKDSGEKPKKKIQSSPSGGISGWPKKKSKPKVNTFVKDKEEDLDDDSGQCEQVSSSEVEMKEDVSAISHKTETDEACIGITDLQGTIPEPHCSPCAHSPTAVKEEDRGRERQGEMSCESNTENRGSRKSERSCKGALYKTLVSEGMLTSLRANIDRGIHFDLNEHCLYWIYFVVKHDLFLFFLMVSYVCTGKRGAFRASDHAHDANWGDDSWILPQMGSNHPKKLKKSKSKDESSQGWAMSALIYVLYNTKLRWVELSYRVMINWVIFSLPVNQASSKLQCIRYHPQLYMDVCLGQTAS